MEKLAGRHEPCPTVDSTYINSLAARAACSRSLRVLEAFFSFLLRSRSSFSIAARCSSCPRCCRHFDCLFYGLTTRPYSFKGCSPIDGRYVSWQHIGRSVPYGESTTKSSVPCSAFTTCWFRQIYADRIDGTIAPSLRCRGTISHLHLARRNCRVRVHLGASVGAAVGHRRGQLCSRSICPNLPEADLSLVLELLLQRLF